MLFASLLSANLKVDTILQDALYLLPPSCQGLKSSILFNPIGTLSLCGTSSAGTFTEESEGRKSTGDGKCLTGAVVG